MKKPDFLAGEGFVADPAVIEKRLEKPDNPILLPNSQRKFASILSNIEVPMFLISGTMDQNTSVADAKSIVAQQANRKSVTFEGKHLTGFWKLTDEQFSDQYINKINSFLKKHTG